MACLVVTYLDAIFDKNNVIKNTLYRHRPKLQLHHQLNTNHAVYHPSMTNRNEAC